MVRKKTGQTAEKPDSARLIESLEEKGAAEIDSFLLDGPIDEMKDLVTGCYCSDLVNLLLDAKKATVRTFFRRATGACKRAITPVVTLYNYRVYLSNPLPLSLKGNDGEIHLNYFVVLGVHLLADDDIVANAYKLLSKAHAPESFPAPLRDISAERLDEIKLSHKMLKTPESRESTRAILGAHPGYCFPERDTSWMEAVASVLG